MLGNFTGRIPQIPVQIVTDFMVNRKALPAGTPVNVKNAEFFKRLKEVNSYKTFFLIFYNFFSKHIYFQNIF